MLQQPGAYGLSSMISGRRAIVPSPPIVACNTAPSSAANAICLVTRAAFAGATQQPSATSATSGAIPHLIGGDISEQQCSSVAVERQRQCPAQALELTR